MDAQELLGAVFEIAPTNDPKAALALGEQHLEEIEARPANAADAETCRLLSISAAEIADYALAATWRRRALLRGSLVGWTEMVAACVMSEAFIAMSKRNDDYAAGKTLDVIQGEPESLRILVDLEPFTHEPGSGISATAKSPSPALIRRFVLEKRGSFQLALGDYQAAVDSYVAAESAAKDARGRVKSRAGLALARYLVALEVGDVGAAASALADTEAYIGEAESIHELDVAATARHNAEVMRKSGRETLLYEIL